MSTIQAPVMILAAPFSGASYLAAMLGGHPRLYAVPELNLFMADTLGELLEIFHLSQGPQAHGLLRALAQLEFGEQSDPNIERAAQWLQERASWKTGEVLMYLAGRAAPRRLVLPDSESPLRPMDLRRIHQQLPDVALLHLLRHPYTQGLLHSHWLRGRLFVPPDFKDHSQKPPKADPQIPWLRCNANIQSITQDRQDAAILRVQSEALVDGVELELTRITTWLGVPAGRNIISGMLQPEDWIFAGYGPPSAPYGLEAEVLEGLPPALVERAVQQARLDAPLPWRSDDRFAPNVVALAAHYGYR